MLLLQQAYLAKKLLAGDLARLGELRSIQIEIEAWYQKESEKILVQAKSDEVTCNERVRIYHHALHKNHIK